MAVLSLNNNFLLNLIFSFLFLSFPIANSVSFNFTSFDANNNAGIYFEGAASSSAGVLQLTKNQIENDLTNSTGWATYDQPVPIWDSKTGRLTDFTTHFSFIIKPSEGTSNYGDGISFFLAPYNNFSIPRNSSGGFLALFSNAENSTDNQIVAVEFDSFNNTWDPDDNHVGINVNSIVSVANVTLNSSIKNGSRANARVSYNSSTQNLSVFLTYPDNPVFGGNSSLSYNVDLSKVLPEQVRIGFSASTGFWFEVHEILSWSFESSLEINNGKNNIGLIIGLVVGIGALVCGAGLIWFFIWRKRAGGKNNNKDVEEAFDDDMDDEFEKGTGPKRFTYRELDRATNNFDEFMPNGSLDYHLFGEEIMLTWTIRYKIALGLASALLYLHEEWEQCVVHRDIKSSNVMLDSNFNAKLGDFGLARLVDHDMGLQTTVLAGTMGYLAPECVMTGKASKESDVYSFGVVALEIACGRRPVDQRQEPSKVRLVEWVWDLYGKEQILEAVDQRLETEFDEQQIECLMIVGLWCCHPDVALQPSIRQVINVLNFEAQLPSLPSKLPMAMYFAPPLSLSHFNYTSTTGGLTDSDKYPTGTSNTSSSAYSSMSISSSKALLNSNKS
ncbi:hypothetical protein LWI29_026054 [Acer saccharum]|uniref:non-specific serine/threonine protein kinase n=1 Tax=Acer saccharum TaxID=4024 RepID=A0AA39T5T0_ACESA|nr:hypothetical protein LWI29_026054 [Acer saccharum]